MFKGLIPKSLSDFISNLWSFHKFGIWQARHYLDHNETSYFIEKSSEQHKLSGPALGREG